MNFLSTGYLSAQSSSPYWESIGNLNLEFPQPWIERVDTARAAHYLAPFMNGRNATHFLADNRAGRTSVPVIPYERIGNRIYYRMSALEEFAWCLARGLGSPVVTTRLHIRTLTIFQQSRSREVLTQRSR